MMLDFPWTPAIAGPATPEKRTAINTNVGN